VSKAPHCTWCILCGKLGLAVGPAPTVLDVLSPAREAVRLATAFTTDAVADCFVAVLPVGARAPPAFVA
jgi:hypothetical protein